MAGGFLLAKLSILGSCFIIQIIFWVVEFLEMTD